MLPNLNKFCEVSKLVYIQVFTYKVESMDMMSFVGKKDYDIQVLVPFLGIWKPCKCCTLPYHIQIHNPAAEACLHSWLNSYHGLYKSHIQLHYNRWLEHSLFNKFPPLGSIIMGSNTHKSFL